MKVTSRYPSGASCALFTTSVVVLGGLFCAGLPGLAQADAPPKAQPWEFVRRDDGITVHRRKVEGSTLHEFRGRGTINAGIGKVIAVVQDSERRTEWVDRCVAARTLERPDERSEISYTRTAGSFPISDRDVVLKGRAIFDTQRREVRLQFQSITYGKIPPVKGVVRMPALTGHWILRPSTQDPRWTDVEYQVHADPGGLLPTFAVNIVSRQIPYKTIMQLRKQVGRANYPKLEEAIAKLPEYQALFVTPPGSPTAR